MRKTVKTKVEDYRIGGVAWKMWQARYFVIFFQGRAIAVIRWALLKQNLSLWTIL